MLLYEIGLELTILFAFWLCLGVWQRDPSTPGRSTFVALGLAVGVGVGVGVLVGRHRAGPLRSVSDAARVAPAGPLRRRRTALAKPCPAVGHSRADAAIAVRLGWPRRGGAKPRRRFHPLGHRRWT